MSETEIITDIPDSWWLQVIEQANIKEAADFSGIEREMIDIDAMIQQIIKEEWSCNLQWLEDEIKNQKSFNKEIRVIIRILRSFPENVFILRKLWKMIQQATPPWRILFHMENIPEQFHDEVIKMLQAYIEQNEDDIYVWLEKCEAIWNALAHISCYTKLEWLLSDIISLLPSNIAFQILERREYNDILDSKLIAKAEWFSNAMTENQRNRFTKRKDFVQSSHLPSSAIPDEIDIPKWSTILQIFCDDDDWRRSFKNFWDVMLDLKFSHSSYWWIHEYSNGSMTIITYDPRFWNDDNILFFLEQLPQTIEMCILRWHTWNIDLWRVLQAISTKYFFIWGCESSKYVRKDVRKELLRDGKESALTWKTFIAARNIGNMKMNNDIIKLLAQNTETWTETGIDEILYISWWEYDVFTL